MLATLLCFSLCQALHVDTLDGLLDVSVDAINNVIHNVTYVRPNGIVGNVSKQGQSVARRFLSRNSFHQLLFVALWLLSSSLFIMPQRQQYSKNIQKHTFKTHRHQIKISTV